MKVYLDCCCLNRPFDDMRVDRNRIEAEAVCAIVAKIEAGSLDLVSSEVLATEISRASEGLRRRTCLDLISKAQDMVLLDEVVMTEARRLAADGFKLMDAAHIACALAGKAQVFLTVDDRLLRRARLLGKDLAIRVESPVIWLVEQEEGESP